MHRLSKVVESWNLSEYGCFQIELFTFIGCSNNLTLLTHSSELLAGLYSRILHYTIRSLGRIA